MSIKKNIRPIPPSGHGPFGHLWLPHCGLARTNACCDEARVSEKEAYTRKKKTLYN